MRLMNHRYACLNHCLWKSTTCGSKWISPLTLNIDENGHGWMRKEIYHMTNDNIDELDNINVKKKSHQMKFNLMHEIDQMKKIATCVK